MVVAGVGSRCINDHNDRQRVCCDVAGLLWNILMYYKVQPRSKVTVQAS